MRLLRALYIACIIATGFAAGASFGWLEMSDQAKIDAQR